MYVLKFYYKVGAAVWMTQCPYNCVWSVLSLWYNCVWSVLVLGLINLLCPLCVSVANVLDTMLLRNPGRDRSDSRWENGGSTAPAPTQRILWCHCYHHCPEDSTNNTCRYDPYGRTRTDAHKFHKITTLLTRSTSFSDHLRIHCV